VEGDTFVPATGTRIVQPSIAQIRLSDGQEVTVEARRRLVDLRFKKKRTATTAATTTAALPPRRR
jgi:antitoxin component of MazEF toxin-antitoxin module